MLFTKITDEKLQLELAIRLDDERLRKVKIDTNQEQIKRFVKEKGYNVMFIPKNSDFHIFLGTSIKLPTAEEAIMIKKVFLKQIAKEVLNMLEELPDTPGKAIRYVRNMKRYKELVDEFVTKAEKLLNKKVTVFVCDK